jgi:nicotinamidase-related amidase
MKTPSLPRSLAWAALTAGMLLPARAATPPPTLLELTHVASVPSRLSESVVVVIDAQREYVDGRLPLAGVAAALAQTRRLLARARAAGVPIIHIRQLSAPGRGVFEPDSPTSEIAAEAAPLAGERIITKKLPNSFAGTTLDEALRALGRKELVISGYMTHMCVSATARSALDHGYHATVIADACATRDLPDGHGGVVAAATVHRVALAELTDRFATVVSTLNQIPD